MVGYRFNTTISTLAIILDTTIEMLVDYAHSLGFDWVNESSEAFYWLDKGNMEFAFFERNI